MMPAAGDRSAACFNGLGFSDRDTALAAAAGSSGACLPGSPSGGQMPAGEKAALHHILDDLKVYIFVLQAETPASSLIDLRNASFVCGHCMCLELDVDRQKGETTENTVLKSAKHDEGC